MAEDAGVSQIWRMSREEGGSRRRSPEVAELPKNAKNCQKSPKVAENRGKSPKWSKNGQKR